MQAKTSFVADFQNPISPYFAYLADTETFFAILHLLLRSTESPSQALRLNARTLKVKVKVKVGFFYSATYPAMPRPAALYNSRKWQLIGKSQWCESANAAATTHTTAPINHTRPSPRKHSPDVAAHARKQTSDYSLLLSLSISKGRKAESTRVAGYIPK